LFSAVANDDREAVVMALDVMALDGDIPIDARGPLRRTACFNAVAWSRTQILPLLIEGGVDFELPDQCGNTPLMAAVVSGNDNGEIVRLLLRAGADPMRLNLAGATPALMATPLSAKLRSLFPTDPNPLGLPSLEILDSTPHAIRLSVGGACLFIRGEQVRRDGAVVRILYESELRQTVGGQSLTKVVQEHIRCYLVALGSPVES
jgi:hypothetical protein